MCTHCCEHSGHHYEENHHEQQYRNKDLLRVLVAGAVTVCAITAPVNNFVDLILFLTAYLIAGYDVILNALKNIIKGKFFDENFLMALASAGAFCMRDYTEAICVMALYQTGEFLQNKAADKSRKSVYQLMNLKPEYANIEVNGVLTRIKPENTAVNDIIIVKPGEKVPLDGEIKEGHSYLDTSSLTGESILREVKEGDNILNGTVNKTGTLKIRVTNTYKNSTVSKILELVEYAGERKSKAENFITKFAKIYTPFVVLCAVLIVLIPLLFGGVQNTGIRLERALTFLVISCPCALVISVPLTFFCAIGSASKQGILIKGSNYIEMLASPDTVVFDKTGTLTNGSFKITDIIPVEGTSKEKLLELAAYAESYSNHPIAISVKEAFKTRIDNSKISDAAEIAGNGVKAKINGNVILAGNKKLMKEFGISFNEQENKTGSVIYIAENNIYKGCLIISDTIKQTAFEAVKQLKKSNIKTIMLTGDSIQNAKAAAEELNIDEYRASLLPSDKVEELEELIKRKPKQKSIIYAGDGINDAPVLMRADVGISMGALGSDAAIEAADVVIADDNPLKIYNAVKIAKRTMITAKENIIFAIGIKILFLILGGLGLMSMWGAVFADTGVTLLAVLNSLRLMR